MVVGLIGQDDSVDLLPLWHDELELHLPRLPVDGATHSVELQGGSGAVLDVVELLPVFEQERHLLGETEDDPDTAVTSPTTHASFEAVLRDLAGGERVVVKGG